MRISSKTIRLVCAAAIALASLTGCNFSSSDPTTLNLSVADTPVDGATNVTIRLHRRARSSPRTDQCRNTPSPSLKASISCKTNGSRDGFQVIAWGSAGRARPLQLLGAAAGGHEADHSITLNDGSVHPLVLTGSDKTGITLVSRFRRGFPEQAASFTVDFDLQEIHNPGVGRLRLHAGDAARVDDNQVATIAGVVSNTFMIGATSVTDPSCSPAAYIYAGANVKPVDINPTSKVQPVATATVALGEFSGEY